jgi:glycosyltransferase involved in cell wall biosynthesis
VDVLLNFLPLKSGGGLQVGLDFLEQAQRAPAGHRWFLVASEGTPLARAREAAPVQLSKVVPQAAVSRAWFETVGCRGLLRKHRPAVIYTQFGPQWRGAADQINVVGCAYSNLCYPEIDFWRRLPPLQRRWRAMRDHLRRRKVQQADAVIFETEDLAARAVRHLGLNPDRVHVVRPSPSSLVGRERRHAETRQRCESLPQGFRVLLLSVYHPNKNFELLPHIARTLSSRADDQDTVFIVTLPESSTHWRGLSAAAHALGVGRRLFNFGPVPQEGCAELYRACDAVILPSQLESFSNTIAESWALERPLVIGDLPWAHALCEGAAAYFTCDSAESAAERILELRADAAHRSHLVECGRAQLARYPTSRQRFERYVSILEQHAER